MTKEGTPISARVLVVPLLLLWLLAPVISEGAANCSLDYNGAPFSLTQLSLSNASYSFRTDDGAVYNWNICGEVPCGNQSSVSACRNLNGTFSSLGLIDTMQISSLDKSGVQVVYSAQDDVQVEGCQSRTVYVVVYCGTAVTPIVSSVTFSKSPTTPPACLWVMKMTAQAACLPGTLTTTTTTTTTTSSSSSSTTTTSTPTTTSTTGAPATTTTTSASTTTTGGTTTTTSTPTTSTTTGAATTSTTTTGRPTTSTTTTTTTTSSPSTTTGGGQTTNTTSTTGTAVFGGESDVKWIVVVSVLSVIILVLVGIIIGMWWQNRKANKQHEFWSEFTEY